ncbi:MAG TPA: magnesium/cobalt transporter CorA [Dehalococcoidia bacterium]|nr:magnesium/cobalt transporter CorA [Dehalococcoidia bacterium]
MAKPTVVEDKLNIEQVTWNGLTWVNIERPTPKETEYLAQNYLFHSLDLDDCLSRTQRPKIDEYEDYLFIVLHFPLFNKEQRVTIPSQVSIFIGKDYLVTLHAGVLKPLVKLFKDCQSDEEACQENMKSSGYLLYRIIDRLIDYCLPITDKIMGNIEKVEDDLFDHTTPDPIEDLSELRRDIISFRRTIWPMRAVISTLEHKTEHFTKKDKEEMEVYWGDLIDHVDRIWDTLDECKEIIDGMHETGGILASHHTNEVIRVLTIIATIMMPLTLVASIYGMNINLPGQEGNSLSFIIILIIMLVISGAMLFFFRRRHWI